MPFKWSKQKSACGISVVKRKNRRGFYHGNFHFGGAEESLYEQEPGEPQGFVWLSFGGPEEDRTPEPFGCEQAPGTFSECFRLFLAVSAPLHFIFKPL